MGQKTRVNGTDYEVAGGRTLLGGVAYGISKGHTRIDDAAYAIPLGRGRALGSCLEGSVVELRENGILTEFYVAKHNYEPELNGAGRTLLVRKTCYDKRLWNQETVSAYAGSTMDAWLNGAYLAMLEPRVQSAIEETGFFYTVGGGDSAVTTLRRKVFLLSVTELGGVHPYANREGSPLPDPEYLQIATVDGYPWVQWTRSPHTGETEYAFSLSTDGSVGGQKTDTVSNCSRPAFTLPGTFLIQTE